VGRRSWRGPNGPLRDWAERKLREAEQTLVAGPRKRGNGLRLAGLVVLERGV
jgi:hypothetical protein